MKEEQPPIRGVRVRVKLKFKINKKKGASQ